MLTICFVNSSRWYNFARTLKTPFVSQKVQFFASYISPKKSRKNQEKMENRQKWLKIVKNDKNKMSKMAKSWNFLPFWYFFQWNSMNWTKNVIFDHFYFPPFCFDFLGGKLRGEKIRFFVKQMMFLGSWQNCTS